MADSITRNTTVLALMRGIDTSDAIMLQTQWDDRFAQQQAEPVRIQKKSVRGTISNRLPAKVTDDPAKVNNQVEKPNLQSVEVAALSQAHDTLVLRFHVRFHGKHATPASCNNPEYLPRLGQIVEQYEQQHGYGALAQRYATNLINGRAAWRNNFGAEQSMTRVERIETGDVVEAWEFDSHAIPLSHFNHESKDLAAIADHIANGLSGENPVLFRVTLALQLGHGMEVYPSQEMVVGADKTLYKINGDEAAMHSQKIGNALRTIDTWYPTEDQAQRRPISVEPYGSVTNLGIAYRTPNKKVDFFHLHDRWIDKDEAPEVEQQHFVMATLIRGGVFGANKS